MKKTLLTLTVITMAFNISAQDTVYFAGNRTNSSGLKRKHSSEQNIIKIAPFSFITGYIPLYFEREITPFLSLQAGAGVTTRNYLKEWANNFELSRSESEKNTWSIPGNEGNTNYNPANDFKNRKNSLGYYFSIQPHIYFENEGLDGSFVSLSYDRARYNSSSYKILNGLSDSNGDPLLSNDTYKEFETVSDISANIGYQTLYDRIGVEYSAGIALRNVTGRRYAYTNDNNSGKFIEGYSDIKKTTPAFTISLKVGYHY
jgi:hypothetical protein